MARPANHAKRIAASVEELLKAVTSLVGAVGATVARGHEVRVAAGAVKKSASATGKKIGASVKAAWARLTPSQRKARIAKMHAWRKKKRK